jgi:iron(III) transport system permease protein
MSRFRPQSILWLALAFVLIVLVANPLVQLISISLEDPATKGWTIQNYFDAFSRVRYIRAFGNSMWLGACVAVLALCFALPIAWALSRTDMPCKGLLRVLVLATDLRDASILGGDRLDLAR